MKKLILFFVVLLGSVLPVCAQWRVGISRGVVWNHYSIDKHYMTDWHYDGAIGVTMGVVGQYNISDWKAVRFEVNYIEKNHRQYRTGTLSDTDYDTENIYLHVPVMASYSFGAQKWRGFLNLGVYGGYWLSSKWSGGFMNTFSGKDTRFYDVNVGFNSERDQRWDFGLVGGVGIEYRFHRHWVAQMEGRCYYSTISTQKDYMRLYDPRYNTAIGGLLAVFYLF